jgi:hypothetical protein
MENSAAAKPWHRGLQSGLLAASLFGGAASLYLELGAIGTTAEILSTFRTGTIALFLVTVMTGRL